MSVFEFPGFLKLQNLRPWWLKMAVLMLIGFPLVSNRPAGLIAAGLEKFLPEMPGSILAWPLITFFIWACCLPSLGTARLLDYLAAAYTMAITTVVSGAVLREILPVVFTADVSADSFRLLRVYFNILAVFPYSLTFLNAFSVSDLLSRLTKTRGRFRSAGLHLALALRICQHVGEVIPKLLLVWREENPDLLLPRCRDDWQGISPLIRWPMWFIRSISQWIFACIILTFEPIPVMVNEIEQINESRDSNDPH
ncbi:MAG: hypothetical protein PHD82_16055 [Candidatus Riflebacteria bacterium]|nr:hypothetical protein [Candidatus Riflebacteria bacterium]